MTEKVIEFPKIKKQKALRLPQVEETEMFIFGDGVVTFSSHKGESLTLGKTLLMLELAKQQIMRLAKIDNF